MLRAKNGEVAMLRRVLSLLILLLGAGLAAPAPAIEIPGLDRDASAYDAQLTRRFPAGATPQQRAAAESRARAAQQRNDWAAAASAWEERIGAGQATPDHWTALADAQLRRTPPEAMRALQAGYRAFVLVPGGPPEIPSLLVMAEALRVLNQPMWQIVALEEVVERAPEDAPRRSAQSRNPDPVGAEHRPLEVHDGRRRSSQRDQSLAEVGASHGLVPRDIVLCCDDGRPAGVENTACHS